MGIFDNLPPAVLLFVGACIVPLLKGKVRNTFLILVPVAAFLYIMKLPIGDGPSFSFLPGFG